MARTPVDINHNSGARRVEAVLEDGTVAGFSEYRPRSEDVYAFVHTEVDADLEGQGIGSQLAEGVMAFARDQGIRILPSCSFIRSWMREHEDTDDLLAPGASVEEDPEEAAS